MPFGFLRGRTPARLEPDPPVAEADTRGPRPGIPFEALTEDWRILATMAVEGRLLDVLNRRERLDIEGTVWQPADGSEPLAQAPGLRQVDPYDLILVAVTPESLPAQSSEEHIAHLVHKIAFDVAMELPPYRVLGTIHLHPGTDPDRLLDRSTQMFFPVTAARVFLGEAPVDLPDDIDAVLANRFYLKAIDQVDLLTGPRSPDPPAVPPPVAEAGQG